MIDGSVDCQLSIVWLQCSEEVDIQEVAEERKLGVITDRQESGAIALVQTWAEAVAVSVIAIRC